MRSSWRSHASSVLCLAALTACAAPAGAGSGLNDGFARDGGLRVLARTGSERWLVGFDAWPSTPALQRMASEASVRLVRQIPAVRMVLVEVSRADRGASQRLAQWPGVAFVEADRMAPQEPEQTRVAEPPPASAAQDWDPYRRAQWYLSTMRLPLVWSSGAVTRTVKVAVVDSGVEASHPDLQGVLLPGYNAVSPGASTDDTNGHGTMCAGLIAAPGGNSYGIHGAAPNARIVPVKVGDTVSSLVEGLVWAADHADLVSMSLSVKPGMDEYPVALESTRRAAAHVISKGVPLVCSMGNTGDESRNVPAAFAGQEVPALIAVAATNKADQHASFSTFGPWCSLAAPGDTIITTALGGKYLYARGTSFATPLVAATVALMLGAGHTRDPLAVKRTLQRTAADVMAPGPDSLTGAGRVDAAKAVLGTR
ncbi:MAG: S8 family serine peptidase [Candidatus Sericytochromatia bacterium]|nr:S8 family serine peptidase [Candidatus Sericytochromatia bacterium]